MTACLLRICDRLYICGGINYIVVVIMVFFCIVVCSYSISLIIWNCFCCIHNVEKDFLSTLIGVICIWVVEIDWLRSWWWIKWNRCHFCVIYMRGVTVATEMYFKHQIFYFCKKKSFLVFPIFGGGIILKQVSDRKYVVKLCGFCMIHALIFISTILIVICFEIVYDWFCLFLFFDLNDFIEVFFDD